MIDDSEDAETPVGWTPPGTAIVAATAVVLLAAVALAWYFTRSPAPTDAMRPPSAPASSATAGAGEAATTPASPAPAQFGRRVIADWIYGCAAANGTACSIFQSLNYSGAVTMTVSWRIEKGADGTLTSVWTMPTNLIVRRGLLLDLGSGKTATLPFESCSPSSCEVRADFAADFLAALKAAPKIAASVTFRNNKGFTFDFSTKGFGDALTALAAASPTAK